MAALPALKVAVESILAAHQGVGRGKFLVNQSFCQNSSAFTSFGVFSRL